MREKISLQCHQKLEQGLERQHTKLQKTLEELRDYQKQHEKWAKMNSKVIIILIIVITTTLLSEDHKAAKCQVNAVQAPLEMRVASRLSYEKYTFLTEGGGIYYHILATSTKYNLVYKTGRTIRPQGCYETLDHGKKFVECVVNNVDETNKIAGQTIYR